VTQIPPTAKLGVLDEISKPYKGTRFFKIRCPGSFSGSLANHITKFMDC